MKSIWTLKRHVLAWLSVAVFASAYLTYLILFQLEHQPGSTATAQFPAGRTFAPISPVGEKTQPRRPRNTELDSLRTDIAGLRQQIAALKERDRELRHRIEIIESAFGPSTSALPPQSEEAQITGSLQRKKSGQQRVSSVSVSYTPLPDDGFGDEMISASPLPIAGLEKSTQTLFGVELASGQSAKTLKRRWKALSRRHKLLLGTLEARRRKSGSSPAPGKETQSLIAGPFPNAAGAARLCARLRAAGTSCKETVFAGEAL